MDKIGTDPPKREWSQRLSLRGSRRSHQGELQGSVASKTMTGSVRTTRRWASLRQHVTHGTMHDGTKPAVELLLDQPNSRPGTPCSQPHSPITPKTPHTPVKKSNWEVIEHFTGAPRPSIVTMARGSEVGIGISAGREAMAEAVMNAGITQSRTKCAFSRFLSTLCASHRFKNLQVEMLYQRYFLRMNQSNMTHVLGLLTGLAVALGILLPLRLVFANEESLLTLVQKPQNLSLALTLVACIAVYAGLVVAISRPGMNEIWLAGVSVAILVTLLVLQVTLSVHLAYLQETDDRIFHIDHLRTGGPLAATWAVCFFIYMAYALLPIRLRHACVAGVIFSVAHLIGALLLYPHDYPALLAHVSVNVWNVESEEYAVCSLNG